MPKLSISSCVTFVGMTKSVLLISVVILESSDLKMYGIG
ncbi:hypothetical protein MNB_SV-6-1777 [hydrothermal vent metagenome]|uniref:Uncharacterized protein n=1 Tax=hydrothermal vent metagenome TaxID=652676 RepID=A0A1W1BZ60_9ZZZZ